VTFAEPDGPLDPRGIPQEFVDTPGLYVHIPFCSRLCPFCPYNKVLFHPRAASDYMSRLRREISWYGNLGPFTSLYVGGGTPTLAWKDLEFLSDLPVAGERAIEVLPSHMTPTMAQRLDGIGFDSVSLGVQSFHDSVLRHLQRPNTAAQNLRAVPVARETFACVDVDLIFDVAYDDPSILLGDLATAFSMGVDQVSTYPLMRFGYTPFGKAHHDRRAEHRLLAQAADLAEGYGYRRSSVWTFLRRDGQVYSSITRPYYLGLGAGAASFTGSSFLVNHFGLPQYEAAVDADHPPVALRAQLPPAAAAAYRIFWQAYTGAVTPGGDKLMSHLVARSAVATALALGWAQGDQQRGVELTRAGYDHFHDAERWVTYHLIEPLWEQMMAEHNRGRCPTHQGPAGQVTGTRSRWRSQAGSMDSGVTTSSSTATSP